MERKVALITGGNAGIGMAVSERLLTKNPDIRLCLACRNQSRAEAARSELLVTRPGADITILIINVSSLQSVYKAAKEIKQQFDRLDYLYLNAGIMPVSSFNWGNFWNGLFSKNVANMFLTGDGLLRQEDGQTEEGLQKVFTTNLFGHFVLVKELDGLLGGASGPTQLIWTSSSNAKKTAFSLDDPQHAAGCEPYAASKYAMDCVSVSMNERWNKKEVYSHSTCPGLVMTNLTYGIMPSWLWYILTPLLWLIRMISPTMNITPENGSEALVWLSDQRPEGLNPYVKYRSQVSFIGNCYTNPIKMDIKPEFATKVFDTLNKLEMELKPKFCH